MVFPLAAKAAVWSAKKAAGKIGDKAGKYGKRMGSELHSGGRVGSKLGSVRSAVGGMDVRGKLSSINVREKISGLGISLPGRDPEAETTPYLGKWDRVSQTWANKWTILLLLVLVRVLISTDGVSDNIEDAKEKVISACVKLETVGSAMASMPHYMSTGINEMAAEGIEGTVNGAVALLTGLISGVQNTIIFFISLWKSTWTCLISALVQGAFDLAAKAVEGAVMIAKKTTEGVATVVEGAENVVQGFIDAVNWLPGVPDIGDIDWAGAIDTLRNLDINADEAVGAIMDVKDKVPTYEELEAKTNDIISIPFKMAKDKINEAWGDFKFDRKLLPVAERNDIALCSTDNRIPDFFDKLAEQVAKMRQIFIYVVIALAFLAILFFAWWEIKRWNRSERTIEMADEKAHDLFDASEIAQHPHISRFAFWMSERMSKNTDTQVLIRWTVAYATTPTALFVLMLALSGFFNCLLQAILLYGVKNEIPKLAAEIGGLAANVVTSLEETSGQWANDTNSVITKFQKNLNDDMFGNIKEATGAVNKALDTFTNGINDGLNKAFGNTPFLNPLKTVVDCVLLDKIEKVQSALKFVEKNAHLTFPSLSNETFSIKRLAGEGEGRAFLDDPEQATNSEISSAVDKVVNSLISQIITEALISSVLLLVYIILILVGVVRAFYGKATGINASQPGGFGASRKGGPGDAAARGGETAEVTNPVVMPSFDPQALQYTIGPDGNHYAIAPDGNMYAVTNEGMPYGAPVDTQRIIADASRASVGPDEGYPIEGYSNNKRIENGDGSEFGDGNGYGNEYDDEDQKPAYKPYPDEYPPQMAEGPSGEKIGMDMDMDMDGRGTPDQQQQYEGYGRPGLQDQNPFEDPRYAMGRPDGGYPSHPPAAYQPPNVHDEY